MGISTNAAFCLVLYICIVSCHGNKKLVSIDDFYKSGVKAYTEDRWSLCIKHFEEVTHLYKLYNSIVTNCRHRCKELSYKPIVENKIEDLQIIELFARRKICIDTCQQQGLNGLNIDNNLSREVDDYLSALEPYNYIHLCYFRMNLLPKAADAALTYLSAHPDDTRMKHNYNYYINQPEVDGNDVVDLEGSDFQFLYTQGVEAYGKKQWAEMVSTMEEVMDDYLAYENKCRLSCEGDQNFHQHYDNIVDYFTSLLKCKQQCQNSTILVGFKSGADFLADVLNHIQFGYYNLEKLNKAVSAVQSYLLIYPNDETMKENKIAYTNMVDVQQNDFVEIPDIVFYYTRDNYEKKLLNFGNKIIE